MDAWNLLKAMQQQLDNKTILEDLVKALSEDVAKDALEYVARMNDIDIDE